jgi:hypothetical protein
LEKSDRLFKESDIESVKKIDVINQEIVTEGVTPIHDQGNGYVEFEQKLFQKDALKELRPDLFAVKADTTTNKSQTNFGAHFPRIAAKGDIFVRVDVLPNRVFKFDGRKWLEQNKDVSQSYLTDKNYLEYLVSKIGSGEYDLDNLNDLEKVEIENYLKGNQNT